ncbi:MAG: orotidine-5'-phosphate decarboxylase [Candidatus Levybacteria bacterium]|nr:orotidine-5'-phosphate decarboxylase [Candidatus Levybacteria bacterium]
MDFISKLQKKWTENKFVCIGLDPVSEKLPRGVNNFFEFNKEIVDATGDLVAAYKPNSAFYEALGVKGIEQLQKTTEYIKSKYPEIVVILDAKRADIGNTNEGYVKFAFDYLYSDAITVHPYLGREALEPFLQKKDKGVFVLCRTSNPGAGEFQDILSNDIPLYQAVAQKVSVNWNQNGNVGLVVGATYPEELLKVRNIDGSIPILIPGVGAQGGDVEETVKAVQKNFLISSSRGIIFASNGEDFAAAAKAEAEKLHNQIGQSLATL